MKKEKMLSKDPSQNICTTRSGIVMFVKNGHNYSLAGKWKHDKRQDAPTLH